MKLYDILKSHKETFSAILQTLALIVFALVVTLLRCSINNSNFDWMTFILTSLISNYMKIVYTERNSKIAMKAEAVLQKKISISKDRQYFYENNLLEELEEEIEKRNKVEKLTTIINNCFGSRRKKKQRMEVWATQYLMALQKNDYEKMETLNDFNLRTIRVSYEKISSSNLFNYGSLRAKSDKSYNYSKSKAIISRSIGPLIISLIVSYFFAVITIDSYVMSGEIFLDLAIQGLSVAVGIWSGTRIGNQIIEEDYMRTLEDISTLTRDIRISVERKVKK